MRTRHIYALTQVCKSTRQMAQKLTVLGGTLGSWGCSKAFSFSVILQDHFPENTLLLDSIHCIVVEHLNLKPSPTLCTALVRIWDGEDDLSVMLMKMMEMLVVMVVVVISTLYTAFDHSPLAPLAWVASFLPPEEFLTFQPFTKINFNINSSTLSSGEAIVEMNFGFCENSTQLEGGRLILHIPISEF